jgi:hypothetical protein
VGVGALRTRTACVSGPANVSNDERTGAAADGLAAAAGAARDCRELGRALVRARTLAPFDASRCFGSLTHTPGQPCNACRRTRP